MPRIVRYDLSLTICGDLHGPSVPTLAALFSVNGGYQGSAGAGYRTHVRIRKDTGSGLLPSERRSREGSAERVLI
jgi:hypothetical protein